MEWNNIRYGMSFLEMHSRRIAVLVLPFIANVCCFIARISRPIIVLGLPVVADVCCFIARISRSIIVLGLPVVADVCWFVARHLGSIIVLVLGLMFRIIVNYYLGVKKKLNVDPQTIAFLEQFFQQEFADLLQKNQVNLYQEQGTYEVVPMSESIMIERAKWFDSCNVIERYINQITTHEIAVSSAAWQETVKQLNRQKEKFPKALEKIDFVFKEDEQRVVLKGKKQDVDALAEFEKATIARKIDLTKTQLELLIFVDAFEKLMAPLKDPEVRIDKKDTAIHFRGPDLVVKQGNMLIWQHLSNMKDQEMELPRSVVSILTSDAGKFFIFKQFKAQHIDAVISSSDDNDGTKLIITAVDRREVNRAIDFIKKTTIEDSVPLAQNQNSLILSNGWKKLLDDFEESMLFKVTTDPGSESIRIAGIKEEINTAKERVLDFLEENTIINSFVEADSGRTKYLLRFKQDEFTKIEDELKTQHTTKHITKNSNGQGFEIRGNKQGTEKATKKVLQLVNQIIDIKIEQPGIKSLFSDSKGKKLLSNIEDDHTCIIERAFVENNMNNAGGNAPASQTKQKRIATKDYQPSLKVIPGIKIDVIVDDIAKTKTHAIVNSVASNLDLTRNQSAKSLSDAAGPQLQLVCQSKGPLKPGDVLVTGGYNLGCKNVFHVVASLWDSGNGEKVLRALIVSCLEEADKRGFSSIAFPAIGTGVLGFPRDVVAKAFFEEVNSFKKKYPQTSVLEVHFVLFHRDQPTIDAFQKEQKSWGKRTKGKRQSQPFKELEKEQGYQYTSINDPSGDWLESLLNGGEEKALDPSQFAMVDINGKGSFSRYQMYLWLFASNESILKEAYTAITQLIEKQTKTKVIDKPASAIEGLSQTQEQHILRLQDKYLTEIQVHKRSAKIIINGLAEGVSDALGAVYEILNEMTEAEHECRIAELVSQTVQWYYDGRRQTEPYDDITNAKIETSFKEKKDSVMITLFDENNKEVEYKIVFATMKEINLDDTCYSTDVHREERGKGIPLSPNWDPQPMGANGKEKDVHLVTLDPFKNQQEYERVVAAILNSSPINIVKIKRVQNPELYRAYMVKKQKMDDKDGSNEKKLFHGTAVDTCDLINHKGFNRSYCGKNATVYGKGVYFARDASYSMQDIYSPPDPIGKRRMYLASVLVGQFTVGNQNMIAPPPKDPYNPTNTYDTTVNDVNNPQVFVAYHDSQVYPEYLITFY